MVLEWDRPGQTMCNSGFWLNDLSSLGYLCPVLTLILTHESRLSSLHDHWLLLNYWQLSHLCLSIHQPLAHWLDNWALGIYLNRALRWSYYLLNHPLVLNLLHEHCLGWSNCWEIALYHRWWNLNPLVHIYLWPSNSRYSQRLYNLHRHVLTDNHRLHWLNNWHRSVKLNRLHDTCLHEVCCRRVSCHSRQYHWISLLHVPVVNYHCLRRYCT